MQHLLKPLVVSWGDESETPSGSPFIDYHEWWDTRDIAAFLTGLPPPHSHPDIWFRQMVSVPLPDETDIIMLKEHLFSQYHIEVPPIEWNGRRLIRVSIQGYNTANDVDVLVQALQNHCFSQK